MREVGKIGEIIKESWAKSDERMFPILNKIDRIWSHFRDKTFLEVIKDFESKHNPITDLELSQALDQYIKDNNIK